MSRERAYFLINGFFLILGAMTFLFVDIKLGGILLLLAVLIWGITSSDWFFGTTECNDPWTSI